MSFFNNIVSKTFTFGRHEVTLETGKIGRQANTVITTMGGVKVLVAVVAAKTAKPGQDFFPLTVNYQEKFYAIGKIPGGYAKREGRQTEHETLISRLIDRPVRPLFPEGYVNEVQVTATVISSDQSMHGDIAAIIGTSAALSIAGIPFNGPIGAAKVGLLNNEYVINPTKEELATSSLELVVAGTEKAVLMVESQAAELSEDVMLGAVLFGHQHLQAVVNAIKEFAAAVNTPASSWAAPAVNTVLQGQLKDRFASDISAAYTLADKQERYSKLNEIKAMCKAEFAPEGSDVDSEELANLFEDLKYRTVRDNILSGKPRIDGRDNKTVRGLDVEVGVLDKAHGSALFTRGETQALVTATLGSTRDALMSDNLLGTISDGFMLHYNFPAYSVGECGRETGPKRREIGHGRLARRGIEAVLPASDNFPFVLRVVSDITESNGSSSMASVCGASLALMDAGVPIKAPVAGIAMGLVKEAERFTVLSDILGDEDHLGDMDFKVAGTANGITALQMDIKIEGITEEIMEIALKQAYEGRIHILNHMNTVLANARPEMSVNAPTYLVMQVNPEKIRDIIGKGGATIRALTEETGATVDIDDSGTVRIFGLNKASARAAFDKITGLTAEVEVGRIYDGTVVRLAEFGAFVNILPGTDGLLHISQISHERIENVSTVLSEGQKVRVLVQDLDNRGRIKLVMKDIPQTVEGSEAPAEAAVAE